MGIHVIVLCTINLNRKPSLQEGTADFMQIQTLSLSWVASQIQAPIVDWFSSHCCSSIVVLCGLFWLSPFYFWFSLACGLLANPACGCFPFGFYWPGLWALFLFGCWWTFGGLAFPLGAPPCQAAIVGEPSQSHWVIICIFFLFGIYILVSSKKKDSGNPVLGVWQLWYHSGRF